MGEAVPEVLVNSSFQRPSSRGEEVGFCINTTALIITLVCIRCISTVTSGLGMELLTGMPPSDSRMLTKLSRFPRCELSRPLFPLPWTTPPFGDASNIGLLDLLYAEVMEIPVPLHH